MANEKTAEKVKVQPAAKKKNVSRFFIERVQKWVDEECERDAEFKALVSSKPEKTVEGACNYVLKCAKETGQAGWDDDEVYGLVRHFFDEDDVKDPGDQRPQKIIVSGHVDLSKEQLQEAKENAEKMYLDEIRKREAEKEKARIEKEKAAAEEKRKKLEEKRARENAMMGDLFGGL